MADFEYPQRLLQEQEAIPTDFEYPQRWLQEHEAIPTRLGYPQRWLQEQEAIPTDLGWTGANGELLKSQRGALEDVVVPVLQELAQ